jgi:hypothetical protein
MHDFIALVWFDVLNSTFWAPIIATTAPDISPFFAIFGAPVIIHELPFRHFALLLLKLLPPLFPARQSP